MRILCISPGRFTGDDLIVGEEYDCIPADDGTDKQNKAFHALLQEYWRSGCHSYNARSFEHFRALIKLYLGAGMEKFCNVVNVDGTPCPEGRSDYRLKSWADYSKKERKETIDLLIAEMIQAGVNTRHFDEILKGMNETIS
jgi:hypothetical protein